MTEYQVMPVTVNDYNDYHVMHYGVMPSSYDFPPYYSSGFHVVDASGKPVINATMTQAAAEDLCFVLNQAQRIRLGDGK